MGRLIPATLPRGKTHQEAKSYRNQISLHNQISQTNRIQLKKKKANQHEFNTPLALSLMVIKMTSWQLIAR